MPCTPFSFRPTLPSCSYPDKPGISPRPVFLRSPPESRISYISLRPRPRLGFRIIFRFLRLPYLVSSGDVHGLRYGLNRSLVVTSLIRRPRYSLWLAQLVAPPPLMRSQRVYQISLPFRALSKFIARPHYYLPPISEWLLQTSSLPPPSRSFQQTEESRLGCIICISRCTPVLASLPFTALSITEHFGSI